ncbi:MAG: hypothetical protein JNL01_13055 [Bdellovibrionales bacterium]|nr:hypothetical protein [Bdellovibrionales bacterium]
MKNRTTKQKIRFGLETALTVSAVLLSSCSTMKSMLAIDGQNQNHAPIANPFGNYQQTPTSRDNIVLRTKKGDRSIEVELPGSTADMTDFQLPLSPHFKDSNLGRNPASAGGMAANEVLDNEDYSRRPASITDREITRALPQVRQEDEADRREIETGLGLVPSEDPTPESDMSYLASMDRVKQLYKSARYEAALLELDELVRHYPTDPKIYEMRGTLLDRLGKTDMAIKSWNQALRFEPGNQALRKFIERRSQKRGIASQ